MADRPAKRQRRSVVLLSDDEVNVPKSDLPLRTPKHQRQLELDHGSDATLALSPNKTRSKALRGVSRNSSGRSTPKSSPQKSRKPSKPKSIDKSNSLHSFFGKATEDQRWQRRSRTPDEEIVDGDFGDAIEDDDLSDSAPAGLEEDNGAKSVLDRRKPSLLNDHDGTQQSNGKVPSSTQRFVKPSLPTNQLTSDSSTKESIADEPQSPWADRYGPTSLEELAIHKKKATDVQRWFEDVLAGRDRQRLLILKGPAGSGKTTTVSLISKALGFQLAFWQNPTSYDPSMNGSIAAQFEDFLRRGSTFGALTFGNAMPAKSIPHPLSEQHVRVVEEFPAGMARGSGSESFRSVLQQLLAHSSPAAAARFHPQQPKSSIPPVVMIISETLLSSSTAFSDSFTAHRLLGPEILNHPLTTVIEFNPVAPTFITKALDLVIKKEAKRSGRKRVPGPAVLQRLAEMGDVRNAISSLEFLCIRSDIDTDWSGSTVAKTKKGSKSKIGMTDMEENSLKLISQRETTLDMFHAAGKIVYNKRQDPRISDPNTELPPPPPEHLMHAYNPKKSEVDIEGLLNETGTDIQTFVSTLYENYILSCNSDTFSDHFEGCSDMLSISDVLNPDARRNLRSRAGNNASIVQAHLQGGSFDALRQDEISFNMATRGLIFHLPYPVSRAAPSSGRKGDAFKMFYPTSLRLWKPTEEIDSLISMFTHNELFDRPVKIKKEPGTEGVADWKVRTNLAPMHDANVDGEDSGAPARNITPSRDTLVLEVLPYMAMIKRGSKQDIKTLTRITHLTGASVQTVDDEPDEDEPGDETIVGAKKLHTGSRFAPGSKTYTEALMSPAKGGVMKKENTAEAMEMDGLYLENDDIVDD